MSVNYNNELISFDVCFQNGYTVFVFVFFIRLTPVTVIRQTDGFTQLPLLLS